MGRGPSLKTKLKAIKKEATAKYDAIEKWYKKHPLFWFQERFKDFAKNLTLSEVAEFMAVLAITPIVKEAIDSSEELRKRVTLVTKAAPPGAYVLVKGAFDVLPWMPKLPPLPPQMVEPVAEVYKKPYEGLFPDWFDWIIAFGLSYIIVHHFGDIVRGMGDMVTGIKGILSILLLS